MTDDIIHIIIDLCCERACGDIGIGLFDLRNKSRLARSTWVLQYFQLWFCPASEQEDLIADISGEEEYATNCSISTVLIQKVAAQ